ncbi:hypothetical protein CP500_010310 [Tychonema bourrellyi FEM_GT703]|uniref:Uncharacterized protein n=1 Tax=Tychonema bourrellyi FEM_GT703 TaxID=2040638 RepID=A0A2G4F152_9CYAN|nr:hypothetical protein CP500_010310 [Tychonema bourrellyi FEM_GT703]
MSQGGILSAIKYQVHVEQAVDTLKADLPTLFEKDIYTVEPYSAQKVHIIESVLSCSSSVM